MSPLEPAVEALSYFGLFGVLFLTGAGLPVPEDAVLLGAGALVRSGTLSIVPTLLVGATAVLAGDGFLFALGRTQGRRIAAHPALARRFSAARVERARRLLERHGAAALVVGRILPGVRAAVFLVAGAAGMPARRFFAIDALATLVHVPALVLLGDMAGAELEAATESLSGARLAAIGVVAAVVAVVLLTRSLRRQRSVCTPG